MTKPCYKIEIRQPDDTLRYTITDCVMTLRVTETLTDGVGTFSFAVRTKFNGGPYKFNDAALFDKVKIWVSDYDYSVQKPIFERDSLDPNFVGRILRINAPLSTESGYIRVFKGRSQGEILQRRIKAPKQWLLVDASVLVTELASDLGLGTGEIETDTTDVWLTVEDETYFSLLSRVSDYWYDADTKITKDFYVDINNNLVWKSRPLRTEGVETLTAGQNIINYNVLRDIESVRNKIKVYGMAEAFYPRDQDSWTESLTDWSASAGTLSLETEGVKKGTYHIKCYSGADAGEDTTTFKRDIPRVTLASINKLCFWRSLGTNCPTTSKVRLYTNGNYFEANMDTDYGWKFKEFSLGPGAEYDAATNPDGVWSKYGTPNWWNLEQIQFHVVYSYEDRYTTVDALYFYPDRWSIAAENETSQTDYGIREAVYTDNRLHSDSECQKRAETLIYQLKDPPTRIDVSTPLNTNILIGDRLSMTIPAERISSANYDVVTTSHTISPRGAFTSASMVNTANIRVLPATSLNEILRKWKLTQGQIGKGIQFVR